MKLQQSVDLSESIGLSVMSRALPARVFAWNFTFRKRAILRRFLGNVTVCFVQSLKRVPAGSSLLLWGSAPVPIGVGADIRIIRIEDGFIRSVGLGADLIHPASWVIDQSGIYYDSNRPSDLETILQHADLEAGVLERASRLRISIVNSALTKYNVGQGEWLYPPKASRVILVPGQVESDASIQYGAPGICTNMALLQAVRRANPNAYLVYKPHPDVLAGLRAPGHNDESATSWCDEVVRDISMAEMLSKVDEVHVITSLAGFEALMRGKSVTCYGLPFYAGWGLTIDMLSIERRSRRLSLDELVAGALISYPTYVSLRTLKISTAETVLEELSAMRENAPIRLPIWRKLFRIILRWTVGVR